MKRSEQATSDAGVTGLSGAIGDDTTANLLGASLWGRWQDSFLAPLFGTPQTATGSAALAPSADLPSPSSRLDPAAPGRQITVIVDMGA